jgi:beta-N-acetylhexosaminidase
VDVDQTLELLNSIKKTNASSGNMPLFFALDEEGGKVARLSDFYTDLPSASKIGDINDSEISTEYGRILGERLKNFGFNVDFAPVLDVNSNPKNPVIGVRAFGSDVDTVVNNGLKVMEGIDSTGVIPVVKHFPGHGDTGTDSHVDLPVINKTLEELESLELVPFKKAIENEAQALMVAHILFRELDSEYPATLSHDIITGLLRENLSYDGVVISDDMTMGAIMENYTVEEASVKFLKAGGDILLICHGYENQLNALNRVKEEVKSGNITEDELDEKVYRIIKLKMKYGLKDNIVENIDLESINLRTKNLLNKINQ